MFVHSGGVFVLLAATLTAAGGDLRNNEMIIGGGSAEADGLWIAGPSLYLRRDAPGVVVGMSRLPGENRNIAYVLVIKGAEPRADVVPRFESKCGVAGSAAASRGLVEFGNKKIAFEHKIEIDPVGKQQPREVLTFNGKTLDIDQGRVMLVDLSSEELIWKQLRIGLPQSPSWPITTSQVETQAKNLLDHLRRADKEARKFLR